MKIKQLVIFTVLNYIFENIYPVLKKLNYISDRDKKLFYDLWILILTTNTNNNNNNNKNNNNNNSNKKNFNQKFLRYYLILHL